MRSHWTRYLNHAPEGSAACNVEPQINAEGHIWFVITCDVDAGTELHFDYGPMYELRRSDVYDAWKCVVCGYACVCGVECVR